MTHPEEKRVVESIIYDLSNNFEFKIDDYGSENFDLENKPQNIKIRAGKILCWPHMRIPFEFRFTFYNSLKLSFQIRRYWKKVRKIAKMELRNKNFGKMVNVYTSRRKDGSLFIYTKKKQ